MTRTTIANCMRLIAILALALLCSLGPPSRAQAASFVVDTVTDEADGSCTDGDCSLRDAIALANANPDADTITFSVTGTIALAAELPDLSSGNVTIAGSNQTVTIDGSFLAGWWTACLHLTSDSNTVKGLVIANCQGHGIQLDGGQNIIGGTTASEGNLIRDYTQVGIYGAGPAVTGNQILGNRIAGDPGWQGDWQGILLLDGASGNTIGGSSAGARNVITGGQIGVWLQAAHNNVIQGNYIGIGFTGNFAIPNGTGVKIGDGASGNSVLDNVISGNDGSGISVGQLFYNVSGSDTDWWGSISLDGRIEQRLNGQTIGQAEQENGTVYSCFFDANKGDNLEIEVFALDDGCGSVGPMWFRHIATNEQEQITEGVSHTCPGPGETIFYWSEAIEIPAVDRSADGNIIQGNRVGTNPAGDDDISNNGGGISVMGSSSDTQIGGTEPGDGNLISGNWGSGIAISGSTQNVVKGNYIGTNNTGTAAISNADGVFISDGAQSNTIGPGNVISGNWYNGAKIWGTASANNVVIGNYIGTDAAGSAALGNGQSGGGSGVSIEGGAHGNTVGGGGAGYGNVIAASPHAGVNIIGSGSDSNLVQGNRIGTNAAGTAALSNGNGVYIGDGSSGTQVGGTTAAERNILSGNGMGIMVSDMATEVRITGNYIGTDAAGTGAIPNAMEGIHIDGGAHDNTVGGAASGERNVISGNGAGGLDIAGIGTNGNVVVGNYVGTDVTAAAAVPNGTDGIAIYGGAQNNTVGGYALGEKNVISHNNGPGVRVDGISTIRNTIRGNSIHTNTGKGIRNVNGGNLELAPPVVDSTGGSVSGHTNPKCYPCTVEVFSDNQDEGRVYHGSTSTNNDATGTWIYPGTVTGPYITATVTDASGNTSEFSSPVAYSPPVGGIAEFPSLEPDASLAGPGSSSTPYAALVGAVVGGVVVLAAGGWYARRRRRIG